MALVVDIADYFNATYAATVASQIRDKYPLMGACGTKILAQLDEQAGVVTPYFINPNDVVKQILNTSLASLIPLVVTLFLLGYRSYRLTPDNWGMDIGLPILSVIVALAVPFSLSAGQALHWIAWVYRNDIFLTFMAGFICIAALAHGIFNSYYRSNLGICPAGKFVTKPAELGDAITGFDETMAKTPEQFRGRLFNWTWSMLQRSAIPLAGAMLTAITYDKSKLLEQEGLSVSLLFVFAALLYAYGTGVYTAGRTTQDVYMAMGYLVLGIILEGAAICTLFVNSSNKDWDENYLSNNYHSVTVVGIWVFIGTAAVIEAFQIIVSIWTYMFVSESAIRAALDERKDITESEDSQKLMAPAPVAVPIRESGRDVSGHYSATASDRFYGRGK